MTASRLQRDIYKEKKNRYRKYRFLINMQYSLVIVKLRHNCTPNSFLYRLISVANYWQYFVKKSQEEPASLKLRDKHATPESPLPPCPHLPNRKGTKTLAQGMGSQNTVYWIVLSKITRPQPLLFLGANIHSIFSSKFLCECGRLPNLSFTTHLTLYLRTNMAPPP